MYESFAYWRPSVVIRDVLDCCFGLNCIYISTECLKMDYLENQFVLRIHRPQWLLHCA